jgi:phosphohistidine phosphatase
MRTTKRVTLLRHAKARADDSSMPDRQRPLNDRGERDAPMMGRRLRVSGVRPSLIITSPALRALHTARLIAEAIGYPLEFLQRESDLYLASPDDILRVLTQQDNAFNDIIVCGHNPGLTELASKLTGVEIDNIPTCGLVVVEAEISEWGQLRRGGTLVTFDYPKNAKQAKSAN